MKIVSEILKRTLMLKQTMTTSPPKKKNQKKPTYQIMQTKLNISISLLKEHKMKWYGHVTLSTGFAKAIMQGGRRREKDGRITSRVDRIEAKRNSKITREHNSSPVIKGDC